VQEVYTRMSFDRKEWQKLLAKVASGDTLVFDSVSRMSGNAVEGFNAYEKLFQMGVELVFLKEPHINTATYKKALENNIALTGTKIDFILDGVNKYLMSLAKEQIIIAFEQSEKEVIDLKQRTIEGMKTAALQGKQIGRKKGIKIDTKKAQEAKKVILKHSKAFGGNLSDDECIKLSSISRNSFYKYKTELKEETERKKAI
jgi:DNA invertase Pin-like site-specific DNA recombinase